jgi:hypothetical protein
VRIATERAALVEREIGRDRVLARRRGGAIDVAVPAANSAALASWVLGLTDYAEILSPRAVRDEFIARLRALAQPARRATKRRGRKP